MTNTIENPLSKDSIKQREEAGHSLAGEVSPEKEQLLRELGEVASDSGVVKTHDAQQVRAELYTPKQPAEGNPKVEPH